MLASDGELSGLLVIMNDGNTVSENTTHLIGDGSYGDTKTVTVGRGEQNQNFTNEIFHYGKNSEGYILNTVFKKIALLLSLMESRRLNMVLRNQMVSKNHVFLC